MALLPEGDPPITASQARLWALYKRNPNEWAMRHVIGRDYRTIVGTTGRQVGKTDEIADRIDQAMRRDPRPTDNKPEMPPWVGVLGPTFDKSEKPVLRYADILNQTFGPDSYTMNSNKHILTIRDPLAGKVNAILQWFSAEESQNVIGHTLSDYFIDEAQDIPDDIITRFTPTMDVRDAHGLIFGTPDVQVNQTWFQGLWDAGQDPLDLNTYSFTIASWDAPWMNIDRIVEAKKRLAEVDFLRLYGGKWVDAQGLVFTGYEGALLGMVPSYDPQRHYVMSVDLAIQNDFNVVMIGDPLTRTAIYYERWNLTDPLVTYDRIIDIHERFGRPKVWVDATGMGAIPARELGGHLGKGMVVPITWNGQANTEDNKMDAVRALAGDLQHRKTMIPGSWDDLIREMKSFVYGRTPSGKLTAAARVGAHDDIVMTLVGLNKAFNARRNRGTVGLGGYNYLNGRGGSNESRLRELIYGNS
jgi:hypothetical protein